MPSLMLALLAAAAAGAAPTPPGAPSVNSVSPLIVPAFPKDAPAIQEAITVGASDFVGAQDVSIWPAGAREAGIGAQVVLACRVDIHGLAETCRIAYEKPYGKGFGAAALALRPTLKLKPHQGPDGPVEVTMNIGIAFKPAQLEANLKAIQAANIPPDGGDQKMNLGNHEINARNLVVSNNPLLMRRVTLADQPIWSQAPSFDEFDGAYPAEGGGVEGYGVAHCRMVRATGALERCVVAKEDPVGHGFGKAAVALAPRFKVSPGAMAQAPGGAPIEVDVPVRFPSASEAKDRTVRSPVWIAGSDPETLIRQFPLSLVPKKASPGAVVRCQVGADGALRACATELTSPEGIDFDDAAVRLASQLRMRLWSADAVPVAGGVVHLPVRLAPAEQAAN